MIFALNVNGPIKLGAEDKKSKDPIKDMPKEKKKSKSSKKDSED